MKLQLFAEITVIWINGEADKNLFSMKFLTVVFTGGPENFEVLILDGGPSQISPPPTRPTLSMYDGHCNYKACLLIFMNFNHRRKATKKNVIHFSDFQSDDLKRNFSLVAI